VNWDALGYTLHMMLGNLIIACLCLLFLVIIWGERFLVFLTRLPAEIRAQLLLVRNTGKWGFVYIDVQGGISGRTYRVRRFDELSLRGVCVFCVFFSDRANVQHWGYEPAGDRMLAAVLNIQHNEKEFLLNANPYLSRWHYNHYNCDIYRMVMKQVTGDSYREGEVHSHRGVILLDSQREYLPEGLFRSAVQ
jgi:hypothetical protein